MGVSRTILIPYYSTDSAADGLKEVRLFIYIYCCTVPIIFACSDGPALRAIALIRYAKFMLSIGDTAYVRDTLWPIIQRDLDYVVENWDAPT